MDATIMPSTNLLLTKLKADFPAIQFKPGESFLWSPSERTLYYSPLDNEDSAALLLHELSHGLLGHNDYRHDITLVAMERSAWNRAVELGSEYGHTISDEVIENHLDTYRDWLHARSTCPNCSANGHQTEQYAYKCLACGHKWRVNEARICALRRYHLNNNK